MSATQVEAAIIQLARLRRVMAPRPTAWQTEALMRDLRRVLLAE